MNTSDDGSCVRGGGGGGATPCDRAKKTVNSGKRNESGHEPCKVRGKKNSKIGPKDRPEFGRKKGENYSKTGTATVIEQTKGER